MWDGIKDFRDQDSISFQRDVYTRILKSPESTVRFEVISSTAESDAYITYHWGTCTRTPISHGAIGPRRLLSTAFESGIPHLFQRDIVMRRLIPQGLTSQLEVMPLTFKSYAITNTTEIRTQKHWYLKDWPFNLRSYRQRSRTILWRSTVKIQSRRYQHPEEQSLNMGWYQPPSKSQFHIVPVRDSYKKSRSPRSASDHEQIPSTFETMLPHLTIEIYIREHWYLQNPPVHVR